MSDPTEPVVPDLSRPPAPTRPSRDPLADTAEALLQALQQEPVPSHIRDLADQLQAALRAKSESKTG